ncbi:hypothetical protein RFI_20839, partial [Reticulomyxa filosa]
SWKALLAFTWTFVQAEIKRRIQSVVLGGTTVIIIVSFIALRSSPFYTLASYISKLFIVHFYKFNFIFIFSKKNAIFETRFLLSSFSQTGLVFLKIAETQTGEMDLIIMDDSTIKWTNRTKNKTESNFTLSTLSNFSDACNRLCDSSSVKGLTPRWVFPVQIQQLAAAMNSTNASTQTSAFVLITNSTRESQMHLSRSWKYPPLKPDEVCN